MTENPSEKLAGIVVDRLIEKSCLRAERREQLIAKISSGTMKSDDWKLEIDLASLKAKQS